MMVMLSVGHKPVAGAAGHIHKQHSSTFTVYTETSTQSSTTEGWSLHAVDPHHYCVHR